MPASIFLSNPAAKEPGGTGPDPYSLTPDP